MLIGLIQSAFRIQFRPWLLSIRDIALLLSGFFSAAYLFLVASGRHISARIRLKDYNDFVSIFNTTLADELCSCLNFQSTVTSVLSVLGIGILSATQIQFGFLLMALVLVDRIRKTRIHVQEHNRQKMAPNLEHESR